MISWWVGWVRAAICTLGQALLAGGQKPAQRQAELMQRGPMVAAQLRGCSCAGRYPEVPAGRGTCSQGRLELWNCSDSGGKHAFHGSAQSPQLCLCMRMCTRWGRGTQLMLPQAVPLSSAFSRPDEKQEEEPVTSRAQAESQVLGSSVCSALDSVCDFRRVSDPSVPQFPHFFSWNREL